MQNRLIKSAQLLRRQPIGLWLAGTSLLLVILSILAYDDFAEAKLTGLLFLVIGGAWLGITTPAIPFELHHPTWQLLISTGRRRSVGLGVLALAVIALTISMWLFKTREGYHDGIALYMENVGQAPWTLYFGGLLLLLVAGLLLLQAPPETRPLAPHPWVIFILIGVAAVLRLYRLSDYPLGIWTDESLNAVWAQDVLHNSVFRPLFMPISNTSGPHLFLYALGLRVFGEDNIQGLRLISALVGVMGIWMVYQVGSELKGRWFGVVMALCLVSAAWSLNFSRIAMTGIESALLLFWSFYHYFRWLRRGSWRDAFLLGISLGVSLWFYQALRPIIAIIGLTMALVCLRQFSLKSCLMVGTTGLVLGIFILPWVFFEQRNPGELTTRTNQLLITNEPPRMGLTFDAALDYNIHRYTEAFHIRGDANWRHNYGDRPLFDPLQGSLVVMGLILALRYGKRHEIWLFIVIAAVNIGVATMTFIQESPNSIRMLPALAISSYFIALPVYAMGQKLWLAIQDRPLAKWMLPAATILALAVLLWQIHYTATLYFGAWRTDPRTSEAFSTEITLVGRLMAQESPNTLLYNRYHFWHSQIAFLWPPITYRTFDLPLPNRFPLTIAPQPVAVWIPTGDTPLQEHFKAVYPQGQLIPIRLSDYGLQDDPAAPILFYWGRLSAADIAAPQGLDDTGNGSIYIPQKGIYDFQWLSDGELWIDGRRIQQETPQLLITGFHHIRYTGANWRTELLWRWVHQGEVAWKNVPHHLLFKQESLSYGLRSHTYRWMANEYKRGESLFEHIYPFISNINSYPHGENYQNDWQGYLMIETPGYYRLWLQTVSQAELWLNDRLQAASNARNQAGQWVYLEEGRYPLVIIQRDIIPQDDLNFIWQTPTHPQGEIVPQEALRPY